MALSFDEAISLKEGMSLIHDNGDVFVVVTVNHDGQSQCRIELLTVSSGASFATREHLSALSRKSETQPRSKAKK